MCADACCIAVQALLNVMDVTNRTHPGSVDPGVDVERNLDWPIESVGRGRGGVQR